MAKVAVSKACIECGLCISTCPKVFAKGKNGKTQPIMKTVSGADEECARKAESACPVSAISVK